MNTEFYWVAVAVIAVMSAARITRLATVDKFPPAAWVRNTYADWTENPKHPRRLAWQLLLFCGYCFGFWAMLPIVVWGYLAGVFVDPMGSPEHPLAFTLWWMCNATLGGSYLAAIVMAHDGDMGDN